jgi:hypothetical protein
MGTDGVGHHSSLQTNLIQSGATKFHLASLPRAPIERSGLFISKTGGGCKAAGEEVRR